MLFTRAHWDSLPGRNLSNVCAIHAQHPTHSACSVRTPAVLAIATSRRCNDVTTLLSLRIMTSWRTGSPASDTSSSPSFSMALSLQHNKNGNLSSSTPLKPTTAHLSATNLGRKEKHVNKLYLNLGWLRQYKRGFHDADALKDSAPHWTRNGVRYCEFLQQWNSVTPMQCTL